MMQTLVPTGRRQRVVGYCSGSGNTLWKALELQRELEKEGEAPFEVVGIFSDNPSARCMETAAREGLATMSINIQEFYAARGADLRDLEVRRAYDEAALPLLAKMRPDIIVLAGYVWAVTDVISKNYFMFGIHPGDLTITENGVRILAGANGVKAAFRHQRNEIRASSYLVTDEVDGGPVLITSPAIPVDYVKYTDEDVRFRTYLKLVNEQNRLVGARTLLELVRGAFTTDGNTYYYKGQPAPKGIKFDSWEEDAYVC